MLFDHIGIFGWDPIEPLILSAALSELSMLLIGDIGCNKTEGSRMVAEALLSPNIEFRSYEVPTLNFDDLVGFVNPKHLSKGLLKFVPTPLSIWNADAALFDEINRANPFIQSKLHELVRNRTLMGLPTGLRMVFSAVNPPERYQSGYMDMALASRFVCVQVPNITDMKDAHIDSILSGNGNHGKKVNLKHIMQKAGRCHFGKGDMETVKSMCVKVARELQDKEIIFNARQLKMMSKLIVSGLSLRHATGMEAFSDPDANTAYVSSVIPEIQGIVRSAVNRGMIVGTIRSLLSGFTLRDPIITARNLEELCDVEVKDSLAWVTAVKQMAVVEEDTDTLRRAVSRIRSLAGKEVIENELAVSLLHEVATRIVTRTIDREDVPVPLLERRVTEIVETL